MQTIRTVLEKYPDVEVVHLFGSRAKGNYRAGSDIDLAIMNGGLDKMKIASIQDDFEESSLPYNVDLVDFTRLEKQEFLDHINRVGILFYQRIKEASP